MSRSLSPRLRPRDASSGCAPGHRGRLLSRSRDEARIPKAVHTAAGPCSRSPCLPPLARLPECTRSASPPTWPCPTPPRRMLSEFREAWSHGAADAEHDSIDTARGDVEWHQEGVKKVARDRARECDEDRDRTDLRPGE